MKLAHPINLTQFYLQYEYRQVGEAPEKKSKLKKSKKDKDSDAEDNEPTDSKTLTEGDTGSPPGAVHKRNVSKKSEEEPLLEKQEDIIPLVNLERKG